MLFDLAYDDNYLGRVERMPLPFRSRVVTVVGSAPFMQPAPVFSSAPAAPPSVAGPGMRARARTENIVPRAGCTGANFRNPIAYTMSS